MKSRVNKNAHTTDGLIKLDLFNTTLKLHVVDDLARDEIIGYDTMQLLKLWWTLLLKLISLCINNVRHQFASRSFSEAENLVCYTFIQPQIEKLLDSYSFIVPVDNDKPSTTVFVEFTIDTGDAQPVYSAPKIYHPEIQKKIDDKLEKLVTTGIITKVLTYLLYLSQMVTYGPVVIMLD